VSLLPQSSAEEVRPCASLHTDQALTKVGRETKQLKRALLANQNFAASVNTYDVKPHVKTNKNDYIDAEAIAEAVTRPSMRSPGTIPSQAANRATAV
jgi:hypothetical protein